MKKLIILSLIFFSTKSYNQSLTGTSGIIQIPSAKMMDDNKLVLGGAFIPKPYFTRQFRNINSGVNTYLTYSILPFLEIMFRYTHELGIPVNVKTKYFPDRMFSFRIRLTKEKKHLPSIVFGSHDFSKLFGTNDTFKNSSYSTNYLVATKLYKLSSNNIYLTLGKSFDLFSIENRELSSLFMGIVYNHLSVPNIEFLSELNNKNLNIGVKTEIRDWGNFSIGLLGLNKAFVAINLYLNNERK